jgi:ABC-type transport system substrate-binding protein
MYGLDRRSIINNLYKSTAINIDSGIPSSDSWHLTQGEEVTEYRPALAKKILQEEGFDFDKTLVLTRYSTDDISVKLLNKIAESWAAIGIKTQIVPVEENATSRLFVDADWYDVALKNLAAVDYTEWYYEYSSENQLWSVVRQNRTEFDSLIESINISKWSYERKLLYEEIQEMETDMVYKIPMAIVPQYVIYRKDHIEIPDIEFPNLWYYFDLKISQWKFTDSTETEQ